MSTVCRLPSTGQRSEPMVPVKEWWPRTRDFLRDVWVEMKKVSWPGRTEVVGTTVVVIVACFLFGFYLFLVDSGLSWLIDKLFRAAGVVA
jgi:preprotein translocase subunit SecE